jgi:hypothetical protein
MSVVAKENKGVEADKRDIALSLPSVRNIFSRKAAKEAKRERRKRELISSVFSGCPVRTFYFSQSRRGRKGAKRKKNNSIISGSL